MTFMVAADGLSSPMMEAILRFQSEYDPVELHRSTEAALVRRGIIEHVQDNDTQGRPRGTYPTKAGMVLAGAVHALWHVTRALIDAKLPSEAQEALAKRWGGMLPLGMIVDRDEFGTQTWEVITQALEGIADAYHPTLHRKAFEPPIDLIGALSQLARKPKAKPETEA